MTQISRRSFLGGASAVTGAAALGVLSGCGSNVSISADPDELVLWYWSRSISPELLEQAATQIPCTERHVRPDVIGGEFDDKLRTSLAGGAYIPDLSAINDNCALYFPSEDLFYDLNEFGARDYESDYYDWKWQLGTTPSDRFCFWPMDTGPTGFYYRQDVFEEAGLPSDPDEVSAAITDWPSWIELGERLRADADVAISNTAGMIFAQFLNASPERYFDESDRPLFDRDGSAVRQAWDVAVAAIEAGITARLPVETDQNAALVSGRTVGHIEAVWWAEILADTAPDTSGNWRLAHQPERAGNSGGSFLTVPHTCKDPEAAFAFLTWLTSPQNQAVTFNDVQLFPSSPDSFEGDLIQTEPEFFGDQDHFDFFRRAAEDVPTTFVSTYESQTGFFSSELNNVEGSGKDPERAWDDAMAQVMRSLTKRGVI